MSNFPIHQNTRQYIESRRLRLLRQRMMKGKVYFEIGDVARIRHVSGRDREKVDERVWAFAVAVVVVVGKATRVPDVLSRRDHTVRVLLERKVDMKL